MQQDLTGVIPLVFSESECLAYERGGHPVLRPDQPENFLSEYATVQQIQLMGLSPAASAELEKVFTYAALFHNYRDRPRLVDKFESLALRIRAARVADEVAAE